MNTLQPHTGIQMQDWRSIETAPRDGTLIEVMDEDCGRFVMRWNAAGSNPLFSTGLGIWETRDEGLTWSEDHNAGPTYWRPIENLRRA